MGGLTVFGMQVSDLERVFTPFHDVVVSFEEIGHRCQFRAREPRNRGQIQPVKNKADKVEKEDTEKKDCENDPALAENNFPHCGFSVQNLIKSLQRALFVIPVRSIRNLIETGRLLYQRELSERGGSWVLLNYGEFGELSKT
jgi:hypothetical protein